MIRSLVVALLLSLAGAQTAPSLAVKWIANSQSDDAGELAEWARAVGPPIVTQRPAAPPPPVESIVVVTWNVHGTHGRLMDFVAQLESGAITGSSVEDYVLLLQEVVRVRRLPPPIYDDDEMERASRLPGTDPSLPDIAETAEALGLGLVYVPSMRNGKEREDRGNAILSTMPIEDAYAFELPFRRQRRVGVAAAITVTDGGMPRPLRVVSVHLDTSEGRGRLYVLGNPRPAQARATIGYLERIDTATPLAIIGGDFNTFLPFENAADDTRRNWSRNQGKEDPSRTRGMVRLDYLFFRLEAELCGSTSRAKNTFGSDHYPVIGKFVRSAC